MHDVVVTVQLRTRIQERVLTQDGTQLTNTRTKISYKAYGTSGKSVSTGRYDWINTDGFIVLF